jgi:hypothetical protein
MSIAAFLPVAWCFGRRLFTGIVILYAGASLTLGGTRAALPAFYALSAAWAFWQWQHRRTAGEGMCRARRFVAAAEVALTNLALALVLAEAALRAYGASVGLSLLIDDTLDAHRLTPGQDYGRGLRGNRLGYPGRDFQETKSAGIFRIAALGDSFALGPAVPFADNYLTILEGLLSDTEIYNFGVSGAGPREYHAILRRDVWRFHPDLVLMSVFVGNDVTEIMATPRHLDPRRHAVYLLASHSWQLARERWRQEKTPAAQPEFTTASAALSSESFLEVEARRLAVCQNPAPLALERKWQAALAHLDAIRVECAAHQVPLAVVLIPDEFQVNPAVLAAAWEGSHLPDGCFERAWPQLRLRAFFADQEVPCLDLLPAFERVPDTYAPRDTHWNRRGNRLAAEQIAAWLRPQLALR